MTSHPTSAESTLGTRILVDARHDVAEVGETGPADEPDIARPDHRHTHSDLSSKAAPFSMRRTLPQRRNDAAQISWLYLPTCGRLARRGFTSSRNRRRMSSSDWVLSTTTTISGLLDEARTSTQEPCRRTAPGTGQSCLIPATGFLISCW